MANIVGIPNDKYEYEFMVAIPQDDGSYLWHSNHTNGFIADKVATEVQGVIIHNIRIQGKKKREEK